MLVYVWKWRRMKYFHVISIRKTITVRNILRASNFSRKYWKHQWTRDDESETTIFELACFTKSVMYCRGLTRRNCSFFISKLFVIPNCSYLIGGNWDVNCICFLPSLFREHFNGILMDINFCNIKTLLYSWSSLCHYLKEVNIPSKRSSLS